MVGGHLKGDRNYTTELHKVLALELLHRLFLDNSEPAGCKQPLPIAVATTALAT